MIGEGRKSSLKKTWGLEIIFGFEGEMVETKILMEHTKVVSGFGECVCGVVLFAVEQWVGGSFQTL